ncbi:hypothetical protein BDF22DRAFT_667683 [Syncephalis plumigaleata]|nr:hypothetical protein BDF22DRAFT_667683 [Syncephalis plumigaleata]
MHSLKTIIAIALLATAGFATINASPVPNSKLLRRDVPRDSVTHNDGYATTTVTSTPTGQASSYSVNNEEEQAKGPYYEAKWTENGKQHTYFKNHAGSAVSSENIEPEAADEENDYIDYEVDMPADTAQSVEYGDDGNGNDE